MCVQQVTVMDVLALYESNGHQTEREFLAPRSSSVRFSAPHGRTQCPMKLGQRYILTRTFELDQRGS